MKGRWKETCARKGEERPGIGEWNKEGKVGEGKGEERGGVFLLPPIPSINHGFSCVSHKICRPINSLVAHTGKML